MDDLVVLRNLMRPTPVRGQSVDSDSFPRQVAFGSRPSLITRRLSTILIRVYNHDGAHASNIKTMALALEFLGSRSINACAGAAESAEAFIRRRSRILRTVVRIDVKDDQFVLFHRAMRNIYRLSKSHAVGTDRGE